MAKVTLTITQTPEGKFWGDLVTELYEHELESPIAEITKSYGKFLADTIKEQFALDEATKPKKEPQ